MKAVKTLLILQLLLALQLCGVIMSESNNNEENASTTMDPSSQLNEECKKQVNCHECIQTLGCVWCKDSNQKLSWESRCFAESQHSECESVENPKGDIQKEKNKQGKEVEEGKHKMQPQVVHLQLRKGEKRTITVEYVDKKHRPLDLYIVMDMSCTMNEHKNRVVNLISKLTTNLNNLTNDLKIGFGSFVDKPLAPFGFLTETTAKSEQSGSCQNSQLAYGFKNHLPLTNDTNHFIEKVRGTQIASNIDTPEGILDGLLQSIVCSDQIGWRSLERLRKLVVVSTDGTYHLAGDGKLVGVVLPHDGMCHVDSTGLYTHSTVLDYPSISVIRQKIQENQMYVIFAVTTDQKKIYEQLSNELGKYAVTHGIDASNSITDVIEKVYRDLVDTVTIESSTSHQEVRDDIDINFRVKCPGETTYKSGTECIKVGIGAKVSFEIDVELKDCPSSSKRNLWTSNIAIFPQSAREDGMTINLTMLCGCECELESSNVTQKSRDCSNHGIIQCGICECAGKWEGPTCNCSLEEGTKINKRECENPKTSEECSGNGKCDSCGKCICNQDVNSPKKFTGKYCECNNMDCVQAPGDMGLCNEDADDGPHGSCVCSHCSCSSGYNGSRCECPMDDEKCRHAIESPKRPCNQLGKCQCGKCVCNEGYTGPYCQIQHAQIKSSCDSSKDITDKCVTCLVLQNEATDSETTSDDVRSERCKKDCKDKNIEVVFRDRILSNLPDEDTKNVCQDFRVDSNGCRINYIIRSKYIRNNTIFMDFESGETIRLEKCPVPAPFLLIGIGVASGMVLIGVLLLLAWKVVTHIHDRKEYARFEKSVNDPTWDIQSPLYISATSAFENPAYSNLHGN